LLLSDVVLDEFDKDLASRGLRFVRYADDCNIFVRSERAGQRIMASIRKFLQNRLRLLVNEEKSTVARTDEIHFLGFRLRKAPERTKVDVRVSNRTKQPMDAKIRELTPRMRGESPTTRIERINVFPSWLVGVLPNLHGGERLSARRVGCSHPATAAGHPCSAEETATPSLPAPAAP
jgi:RNA-directed DNA polymerase